MKSLRCLLVVFGLAVVLVAAASPARAKVAQPSAVAPWIEFELNAIASHSTNPPRAARALAHVSRAMYGAAVDGGRGRDDAVAGAASTVLAHLYPDEAARIAVLAGQLGDVNSPSFARGVAIGRQLVARADADGSGAVWTGSVPDGAGFWVPTPPAFINPPLEPLAGTWRTWNLRDGSQFRPAPPPAFRSPRFNAELDEVYAVSQALTTEQKRIANFWADGAGTVTPPGHWNRIALDLVRGAPGWSTARTSLLFSALNTAQADAFIACWDAKYAYWTLRPVTAIRRLIKPAWSSYIVTPPFPSYVSGHSTTSGAASTVLAAFFPQRARELKAMADEAAVSRLYGGIHFRSDNDAGLELGHRVGTVAVQAYRSQGQPHASGEALGTRAS
jgi:membrane-associated phospholipid phosphatase